MPATLILGFGFVVSLVLSLLLTFGTREWAKKRGLYDRPDSERKAHAAPTPDLGGVAIFGSTVLTLGLGAVLAGPDRWGSSLGAAAVVALSVGGTLVWLLGLLDDIRGLPVSTRFMLEIVLAGLLVVVGVRIDFAWSGSSGGALLSTLVAVPLTMVWIVGVTNAFNLLDGSDGVAGGSALIALLTLGVLAIHWGQPPVAAVCFVLAGSVAGFLFFNFPPASIFMGDSGSLFIGFSLATIGVLATQNVSTPLAFAIPIVAVGVPVLDTLLAIVRRILRGDPVHLPDKGHIHHRLHQLGHSPRRVAMVVWGVSGVLCLLAILAAVGGARTSGVALALAAAVVVLFVRRLHVPELVELVRMVRSTGTRRARLERGIRLHETVQGLEEATTPEAVLEAVRAGFSGGEFSYLVLWLDAEVGTVFSELEGVRKTLRGYEVTLTLSGLGMGPEEGEVDVRLAVVDTADRTVARLGLKHGRWANRFPTDLRTVVEKVVPALRGALLRVLLRTDIGVAEDRSAEQVQVPPRAMERVVGGD